MSTQVISEEATMRVLNRGRYKYKIKILLMQRRRRAIQLLNKMQLKTLYKKFGIKK